MLRRLLALLCVALSLSVAARENSPAYSRDPWIAETRLPPEARETLRLIDRGGPYPYRRAPGAGQHREPWPGLAIEAARIHTQTLDHSPYRRIRAASEDVLGR